MIMKELRKEKAYLVIYLIINFVILSGIYLMTSTLIKNNSNKVRINEISKNEERLMEIEKNILSNKINSLVSDLLYISDNLKNEDYSDKELKRTASQWKDFSDKKKIYDQIRYIDMNGDEKIRVNYLKNGSTVVENEKCQNKKNRYYFTETIKLDEHQVYISKMDLNVENGKVEEPLKPMIRLCTPVFTKDKKLKGIVILNYYAENLIQDFKKIGLASNGSMFLLDSNGYWIYNEDNKEKEWTFMYDNKKNISFKNEFSNEWKTIKEKCQGTKLTRNGYFSYANIIPYVENKETSGEQNAIVLGEGNWIAVSYIHKNSDIGKLFFMNIFQIFINKIESRKVTLALIFAVSLTLSILLTLNKISKKKIKYFSEYDIMTETFNRRAGFDILNEKYLEVIKGNKEISICFVDVNGLKGVNDNLGHKKGDELILTIVNGIKKHIDEKDFVIRLGGDEFLVILVDTNKNKAEDIWNKIRVYFKNINENENREYIVSASHGIEQLKKNCEIDEIINMADEKMYEEKKIIKKNLQIVRKNNV